MAAKEIKRQDHIWGMYNVQQYNIIQYHYIITIIIHCTRGYKCAAISIKLSYEKYMVSIVDLYTGITSDCTMIND